MAVLTIRNLDEGLKGRLRVRAASRGRSMEEEARHILRAALGDTPAPAADLTSRIRQRFAALGGVELPAVAREPVREPELPPVAEKPARRHAAPRKAAAKTARRRR